MARLVEHERNTPYEIAEGTELPVYICACGPLQEQAVLRWLAQAHPRRGKRRALLLRRRRADESRKEILSAAGADSPRGAVRAPRYTARLRNTVRRGSARCFRSRESVSSLRWMTRRQALPNPGCHLTCARRRRRHAAAGGAVSPGSAISPSRHWRLSSSSWSASRFSWSTSAVIRSTPRASRARRSPFSTCCTAADSSCRCARESRSLPNRS